MKKLLLPILAGLLSFAPAAVSAATFEGKITSKITSPDSKKDGNMQMISSVKEGYYRVDMEAEVKDENSKEQKGVLGGMIMDLKKQEMIMLMPQQKMYMTRAIPKPDPATEGDKKEIKNFDDFTVERTGKTDTILGYKCEQVLMKSKNLTVEIWGTDQLGTYMGMGSAGAAGGGGGGMFGKRGGGGNAAQAWEKALAGKEFFPLRTVVVDSKGKETMRTEVTAIEKKKLADSDFAPPADYQKFDMGSMFKGAIPGFGK